MNDVNWWLMALAFLLGLLLTFAFMIRRVKREVPVYAALGRGPGVGYKVPDVDVRKPDVEAPAANLKGAGLAAGAGAVGGAAATKFVGGKPDEEPYGSGSLRLAPGAVVPSGYTIKGNEDSMLYHSPDSPSYKETDTEVWFRDKESAERAGFTRWDLAGGAGAAAAVAGAGAATAKLAAVGDVPAGPYGAGSAKTGAGGSGPEGWTIKGNEDSMLYHTPESPSYKDTIAEVWFADEATADSAGFKKYK